MSVTQPQGCGALMSCVAVSGRHLTSSAAWHADCMQRRCVTIEKTNARKQSSTFLLCNQRHLSIVVRTSLRSLLSLPLVVKSVKTVSMSTLSSLLLPSSMSSSKYQSHARTNSHLRSCVRRETATYSMSPPATVVVVVIVVVVVVVVVANRTSTSKKINVSFVR